MVYRALFLLVFVVDHHHFVDELFGEVLELVIFGRLISNILVVLVPEPLCKVLDDLLA